MGSRDQNLEKWINRLNKRELPFNDEEIIELAGVMKVLEQNKVFCEFKLKTKEKIHDEIKKNFGDRVIETKPENVKPYSRWKSNWANDTVKLFLEPDMERDKMEDSVYFSYIKFAKNRDTKESYGIAGCMSSFSSTYNSDLEFYGFNHKKKGCIKPYNVDNWARVPYYMLYNNLEWDTDEVLIIRNDNNKDACEKEA